MANPDKTEIPILNRKHPIYIERSISNSKTPSYQDLPFHIKLIYFSFSRISVFSHLKQASAEPDLLAAGIADTINQAQKSGLDLNGLQGADVFEDINSSMLQQGRVLSYSDNTGTLNAQNLRRDTKT